MISNDYTYRSQFYPCMSRVIFFLISMTSSLKTAIR